ncbi:hypothetical protein JOC75_000518 [Metabacillus crassostreae]|uniref:hypothetical protein n=1 Tax=Metabacillus crassostreae TaxID=929098 RepID=UPI001957EC7A|nr:hypothetical protein [Metabacillus crassostreae]MBM7602548.1 hypothetical protein [Metabacillus crassostreae]
MIIKELYLESLLLEESPLAHYIFYLLNEKKISLNDDVSKLNFDLADHQKVAELIENNVLGFHKVDIFSLKMNQNEYVFIFADSKQKAIQFFKETFGHVPMNCHAYSLDYELTRGNEVVSFRKMRMEYECFPVVAGFFNRVGMKEASGVRL